MFILFEGAVSFGQIVKAGEPVFAAATNALLLGVSHNLVLLYCHFCFYFLHMFIPSFSAL